MNLKGKCTILVIKNKPTRILLPGGISVECTCELAECKHLECKKCESAIELLGNRWNLCEPDGPVEKMAEACRIGLSYVNAEMQGAPRPLQDLQVDKWEIEQALAAYRKAEKEKT